MSAKGITDELVKQVADDLRTRYGLDDEDVRGLADWAAPVPPRWQRMADGEGEVSPHAIPDLVRSSATAWSAAMR